MPRLIRNTGARAAPVFFLFAALLHADCTLDTMKEIYNRRLFRPGRDVARNMFLIATRSTFMGSLGDVEKATCQGKAYAWELLSKVGEHTPYSGSDWSRWHWREPGRPSPSLLLDAMLENFSKNPPPAPDFDTFEMVHLNPIAGRHAQTQMMSPSQRKKSEDLGWRTFKEFPANAIELKTIWRRIPKNGCIALGVWDDLNGLSTPGVYREEQWGRHVLIYDSPQGAAAPACNQTASPTQQTDLKLRAQDHFIWMRVSKTTDATRFKSFKPAGGNLAETDLLILAGMHISRKDFSDWAWATTWWKGKEVGPTAQEVLGRNQVIPDKSVWSHYVMKYALSFQYPCSGIGCSQDHRTFVYNPYLEAAKLPNGTASNCIACHAKARYPAASGGDSSDVPDVFGSDLKLFRFEGTTMTDYSWTAGKK